MPSEAQCVGFVICSGPVGGEVVYLELRIYMKTPLCLFDSEWLSHKDTKPPEHQAIHRCSRKCVYFTERSSDIRIKRF